MGAKLTKRRLWSPVRRQLGETETLFPESLSLYGSELELDKKETYARFGIWK